MLIFLLIFSKIAIYLSLGLHKGRSTYGKTIQPSKKNIQHFKTKRFLTLFYFCESFLPSWIRIQLTKINADPI